MAKIAPVVAVLILLANGIVAGIWSHRWELWTDDQVQRYAARIEKVPLRIGTWDGVRTEIDPVTHPEEMVGKGVNVRYTDRTDGTVATVYLACGPTDGLVSHSPQACYVSNGYTFLPPENRVWVASSDGVTGTQLSVTNFVRSPTAAPTHFRVFSALSDGNGWQIPENPRRTFRRNPVIYKVYVIRQLTTPDEPIDGDPCLRLIAGLLPAIDDPRADGK